MDDEAMKAMSRRIVKQCYPKVNLAGAGDLLKVALAAIIETRDRDAALADEYEHMVAGKEIAAAIRSGQQFRKDV